MSPLDLLIWAGAIMLTVVMATVSVALIIGVARSIKKNMGKQ